MRDKYGSGNKPGTFPFVMGVAQLVRSTIVALGFDPSETFEARKLAEQPSWVLLDDAEAPNGVVAIVVSLFDERWVTQNATAMDFTRVCREVILRLQNVMDDLQPGECLASFVS